MKYCENYAALLDLFVDGELTADEMEQVQAHLKICPGCQAYVDDALAIRAGFPDVEDTIVPAGFAGSVMERIRKDSGKGAKTVEMRRPVRRWAGTLTALAACCALVVLVGSGGFGRSDSILRVADQASSGAEVPAAYTSGAGANAETAEDCDAGEDAEYGIEPQMAPEAQNEGAIDAGENEMGPLEARTTAGKEADFENGGMAGSEEYSSCIAATPDTAAADTAEKNVLYLTAEDAGDLLDGTAPVWESAGERHYELNAEEYRALSEALGRTEDLLGTEEAIYFIIVRD